MCIGKCGISRDTRDKPITCPTPFLPVVGKDLMLRLLAVWEVPGPFRDSSPIHDAKDRQNVNGFRRAKVAERLLHACVTRDTREGVGVGLGATCMCWSPALVCTKQPMTPASSMSITSVRSLMPQS